MSVDRIAALRSLIAQQDDQTGSTDGKAVETQDTAGPDSGKELDGEQMKASTNNGTHAGNVDETESDNKAHKAPEAPAVDTSGSGGRFEALVRDRDSLRAEVTDMRKSLEEIQSKHRSETKDLQEKLDDAETKREHAESQFQKLLERVNTIKAQLGERLKEDSVRRTM